MRLETLAARRKLRAERSTRVFCSISRRIGNSTGERCSNEFGASRPAAYLKVCAMLVPKDMKVEHSGGIKAMSDEEIEQAIEVIQSLIAARAGEAAKVIEAEAEAVPGLPAPGRPMKAS